MSRADELDAIHFEKLHGETPWRLLDRHPDGQHIAMQATAILDTTVERAAIWDADTGKLFWAPEGICAMTWLRGGALLALVAEDYTPAPDHPPLIGSPLQREFAYTLMLLSWPERDLLGSCGVSLPLGWPVDLVVSPRGDLAIVQWCDQTESGLEFFALEGDTARQIEDAGIPQVAQLMDGRIANGGGFPLNTNLVGRPVFSPDGCSIVFTSQDEWAWWAHRHQEDADDEKDEDEPDPDAASPGGEYTIGALHVIDWQQRRHRAIPIVEHVPPGWRPAPDEHGGEGLLIVHDPVFGDDRRVTLMLPTGAVYSYDVGSE